MGILNNNSKQKMNVGEIIELNIDKLVYGGDGIGKYQDLTIFVADVAPGDYVKAEIISIKKNYAKALLKEVLNPSVKRVKPFCPYANVCGGCQWQHIDYEEQLSIKKNIVEETIRNIAGIDVVVNNVLESPETKEYRCKVQLPVQQTKVSKRFLAGYYKKRTHEIVNSKFCPVQPAILDEITEFIRVKSNQLNLSAYNEKNNKGLIRHIVYRYSKTNRNLTLTLVINSNKIPENINKLLLETKNKFNEIVGVLVNFNTIRSNVIIGSKTELVDGADYIEEVFDGKSFKISASSFFQVNPNVASKMFSYVKYVAKERLSGFSALDVYAGSGAFSIYLSDIAKNVVAVEESESSINDGLSNLKMNDINNIEFVKGNADIELNNLVKSNNKYDLVILDPPRKGCSREVLESVKNLADRYLIYVSCNPSTLARDIKILKDNFTPEFIQPVDIFCHTYHVESIAVLKKIT